MNLKTKLKNTHADEAGSATVAGLSFFVMGAVIAGIALDQANAWKAQTQLQIAADAAALAAAANLSDQSFAEEVALTVATMNLGTEDAITAEDIQFGHIDLASNSFVAAEAESGAYDAVRVNGMRVGDRGNSVPTYLMKLIGITEMDVTASAVAAGQIGNNGGGFAGCEDAAFISTKTIQTGGSNEMHGAVCIHGALSLATGGGDYYNPEVRLSSEELEDIYIASYGPDDLPEEQIKVARTMDPVLLPQIDGWQDQIFDDLWLSRSDRPDLWEQPDTAWGGKEWFYIGEYELSASDYDGILPSFVFDGSGMTTVYMRDTYWSIQPGDLEEHSIYLSSQGIAFSGNVDIENAAIVSRQGIQGGGGALYFDDVFFLGTQLNFPGNVTWGADVDPCTDYEYGVYTFGTQSLSLGGWASGSTVNGMVGAAPRFSPGGAMNGTGVYFETDSSLSMGGNFELYGCGTARSSEFTLADMTVSSGASVSGSYLFR